MSETQDDALPTPPDPPRYIPGQPLPRLWKTEPDEDEEEDDSEESPGQAGKKKKKRAKDRDVAAPAPRFAPKKAASKKPAQPKLKPKKKADDGPPGEKKVLIEETPRFDTIEARQRARMVVGALMVFCVLIVGWIVYGMIFSGSDELAVDAVELPPQALTPMPATAQSREPEARYMLDRAREYARRGQAGQAIGMLNRIVSVYKGTVAAREAEAALARPGQHLPLFPDGPFVLASKTSEAAPASASTAPPPATARTGPPSAAPAASAPPVTAPPALAATNLPPPPGMPPQTARPGTATSPPRNAASPPPYTANPPPIVGGPPQTAATTAPPPAGSQNPGTVGPAPPPGTGANPAMVATAPPPGPGAVASVTPPPRRTNPGPTNASPPGQGMNPGTVGPPPAGAPAMGPSVASNAPPPAPTGGGGAPPTSAPPTSAPPPGSAPGASANARPPSQPTPAPPSGPGEVAIVIPDRRSPSAAMPPAGENASHAGTSPDHGANTAGRTARKLPPGFRAKLEAGVHESGWPMVIVGERDKAIMVLVPGGTFTMGIDRGEPMAGPAHFVQLSTYYIDQHEVTKRQFRTFLDDTKYRGQPPGKWSTDPKLLAMPDDAPAVAVSYQDAEEYALWAHKRLPSEAQWEMAARSVDGRRSPWGDEPPRWSRPRKLQQIDPVMSFPEDVSPFGVFDMGGNAVEWVRDWYDPAYYHKLRDKTTLDPTGPPNRRQGIQRVVKGDSRDWLMFARHGMDSDRRLPYLGFRCSLAVEGSEASAIIAPRPPQPSTNQPGTPPPGQGGGNEVPF